VIERYYFIVRYLPKRADCSLLAGRCIKELHHIFSQTEESIAVSFPEWTVGSLGPSIGFVSSSVKYLEALRNRSYFIDMQGIGAFELTKVLTVPNEVGEVRFIRNQRVAKLFSGEFRRRYARGKKRAEARWEGFNPEHLSKDVEVAPFNKVAIQSSSSKQHFILHIQKEFAEAPEATGLCSYGFATACEKRGTVPDLSSCYTFI